MLDLNFVLLYVDDPLRSARFYSELLDREPVESAPTFVRFKLASGLALGLWLRGSIAPPATLAGGSELAFAMTDPGEVQRLHADWVKRGVAVVQAPLQMDFGFTFTALDPDGHRLRVFCPTDA